MAVENGEQAEKDHGKDAGDGPAKSDDKDGFHARMITDK
jgi:hypothetical protein